MLQEEVDTVTAAASAAASAAAAADDNALPGVGAQLGTSTSTGSAGHIPASSSISSSSSENMEGSYAWAIGRSGSGVGLSSAPSTSATEHTRESGEELKLAGATAGSAEGEPWTGALPPAPLEADGLSVSQWEDMTKGGGSQAGGAGNVPVGPSDERFRPRPATTAGTLTVEGSGAGSGSTRSSSRTSGNGQTRARTRARTRRQRGRSHGRGTRRARSPCVLTCRPAPPHPKAAP